MPRKSHLKPRKQPLQPRSRATVDAILEAATHIFRQHGYAAGTTDRIAEKAGVSVGSLYQYFPNKDALLVSLAERHIDEGFARVREIIARVLVDPPDLSTLLHLFVDGMMALHSHEPELHRVLFEEAPLPPALRKSLRKRENALAGEVQILLKRHSDVQMRNSSLTAYVIVQTIEGLVHGFILHPPDGIDAAQLTQEVVQMLHGHLVMQRP